MFQPQKTIKNLAFIVSVFAISFSLSNFILAWTEPTATPPGNNVSTPINEGSLAQVKNGDLSATSFFDTTDPTYYINPSAPLSANLKGDVQVGGAISATKLTIDMQTSTAEGLHISRTASGPNSYLNIKDEDGNPIFKVHESGKVGIGISGEPGAALDVNGDIKASGAIKLGDTASTCNETTRGTTKYVQGGTGVADSVYYCKKNVADAYSWEGVISPGIQIFTVSDTWIKPSGYSADDLVSIQCWGAGGGGGGAYSPAGGPYLSGSGGGGGGYSSIQVPSSTVSLTVVVTVGLGGVGGVGGVGSDGGDGGDSSFGGVLTAVGGGGGGGGLSGIGGIGGTGDTANGVGGVAGGNGGNAGGVDGGAGGAVSCCFHNGSSGEVPGGGGGGAIPAWSGGSGAAGYCIVTYL